LKTERLHKRIAASGLCSRRAAEKLIAEGRVQVDGHVVTEMGVQVGPESRIAVDGRPLGASPKKYAILNKPKGYVTTLADPHAKRTIKDLMPEVGVALKPVGRLDKDTEGLLLLTNDGELALRLTHPRFGVEKEYQVMVEGRLDDKARGRLESGLYVEGRKTSPAQVDRVFFDENKNATLFTRCAWRWVIPSASSRGFGLVRCASPTFPKGPAACWGRRT
jgi:23S rRNA pseudouridine2605 synthase